MRLAMLLVRSSCKYQDKSYFIINRKEDVKDMVVIHLSVAGKNQDVLL